MNNEYKCQHCDKIHVEVTPITSDEALSFKFISQRVETAKEYLNSVHLNVVKASMEVIADNQTSASKWWDEMAEKYKFNRNEKIYNIDYDRNCIFYIKGDE